MAPNKFENQIKKELSNRSIAPSAQAWDRLDAMLAVAENKTTKNSNTVLYKWIGIAALITIVFSIVVWNTSQTNQNSTAPNQNIVTTQKSSIEKYDSLPNAIPTKIENTVANPFFKVKRKIAYKTTTENIVQEHNSLSNTQQEIKNTPIAENNINTNTISTKTVTVDADELLLSVEQNHTKKTNYRVKLNANTLLAHADKEVELTFREKMLQKINKNYQEVKVAIINRNKE
jgi:hypothetical protein